MKKTQLSSVKWERNNPLSVGQGKKKKGVAITDEKGKSFSSKTRFHLGRGGGGES